MKTLIHGMISIVMSGIIFVLMQSCGKIQVSRDVRKFVGTEIVFPSELQYIHGTNNYYNPKDTPVASVVYWFDENECNICKLSNLGITRKLFDFCRDSVSSVNIRIVFTPSFEKKDLFLEFIENSESEFPIYVDRNNSFGTTNPTIPKIRSFHAFLLDNQNRVILVGDPLMNEKMWSLYITALKTISSNSKK